MKAVRWNSPFMDLSGYASAARGYAAAADAAGVALRVTDTSRLAGTRGKGLDDGILRLYSRHRDVGVPSGCPTVQHQVPSLLRRASGPSIGYTVFEMTRVPKAWVPLCNAMDELWTASEYSRDSFASSGVTVPIRVLPHAVDVDSYTPGAEPWAISNRRSFAFLSVFDFTDRKAWREMLRAYWHAFGPKDDVCLILKVFFSDFSEASKRDIMVKILEHKSSLGLRDTAPILLYPHDVPEGAMPGLYRAADCYVGMSREGFGLSYAMAMACGMPCIGPGVGGNRQFMNEENSLLVRYQGDEPVSQEMLVHRPDFQGLSWSTHSWEHCAELMRKVAGDSGLRATLSARAAESARTSLSYGVVGRELASLLPG